VSFYCNSDGPQAISRILAAGLRAKAHQGGPRAVIYTAENHNHAAEILQELVLENIPSPEEQDQIRRTACFVNTVIGKMSGVISNAAEIAELHLTPMTPENRRAFLVEAFNHILISRIHFEEPGFRRGIETFIEKDDLLPFEEAKLYGHNATHALGAFVGWHLDARRIADLSRISGMMDFLRKAFIDESGAALIHRYQRIDPLFTLPGYTEYADDLLDRMVNPNLADTVERVGRDIERKLGWDDRLVGTMRCALSEGIQPVRFALGAAAALAILDPGNLERPDQIHNIFLPIWGDRMEDPQAGQVLEMIQTGLSQLRAWKESGNPQPEFLFNHF
jgi:mannitol-1-phosphate 5-dehydrogenase